MANENSQKVIQNIENHIHLPSNTSELEINGNNKKNYKWLWTLVIVPIAIAVIYNWDKFFSGKVKDTNANSVCSFLNKRLSEKTKELENIENLLRNNNQKDYLKLSSDSMSHAIQINQIKKQLKDEKCTE